MRRNQMRRLFALLAEYGGTGDRHGWASGVLSRRTGVEVVVVTFRQLTEADIQVLITALDGRTVCACIVDDHGEVVSVCPECGGPADCGAPCPDGWPCVVDAGHVERGEDHARVDGLAWAVR